MLIFIISRKRSCQGLPGSEGLIFLRILWGKNSALDPNARGVFGITAVITPTDMIRELWKVWHIL